MATQEEIKKAIETRKRLVNGGRKGGLISRRILTTEQAKATRAMRRKKKENSISQP